MSANGDLLQDFLPARLPTAQAAALLPATGDDAAPLFFIGKQLIFLIGRVGGDLQTVIVRIEEIDAAFAFRSEPIRGAVIALSLAAVTFNERDHRVEVSLPQAMGTAVPNDSV